MTVRNLLNVGRQVSLLGIMAVGMTFVLISREIDLSVGAVYALAGLMAGMLIVAGWNLWVAILIGLLIGVGIGAINGLLSTYALLPSFIATLGMMSVVRGAALLITNGEAVTVNDQSGASAQTLEAFYYLGQGRVLDLIPMQLVFFVAVAVAGWFVLSKTVFGFKVYAVGGSDKAARVSGIKVFNTKIFAFVIMGFLAALSGILSLAFLAQWPGGPHRHRGGTGRDRRRGGRRGIPLGWGRHHLGQRLGDCDHRRAAQRSRAHGHLAILATDNHWSGDYPGRGHRQVDQRAASCSQSVSDMVRAVSDVGRQARTRDPKGGSRVKHSERQKQVFSRVVSQGISEDLGWRRIPMKRTTMFVGVLRWRVLIALLLAACAPVAPAAAGARGN